MKVELTEYDRHYLSGGFKYDPKWGRGFLIRCTSLPEGAGTLLDAGCGDGFWSEILSEWYTVRAEDRVLGGVVAGALKENSTVDYYYGDSAVFSTTHDVVFARGISYLVRAPDDIFMTCLEGLISRALRRFVFITYTEQPYGPLCGPGGDLTYNHDPKIIEGIFSQYGKVAVVLKENYIIATIDL
jgi:hypothetical protein